MTLLAVGVSHRTADNDLLEALAAIDSRRFAAELLASPHVAEVMAVSTCNRVEIYCEVDRFHAAVDDVVAGLAKGAGMTAEDVTALAYVHYEERAVQHLFEVTAGLDSMVVGEAQILGQVRSALVAAQELGAAGRELNEVGQAALRVGKRIRTQTGIDRSGANVVSVGFAEALEQMATLGGVAREDAQLLVVGAGSLSALAVAHAQRNQLGGTTVISRTRARASELANSYGARDADLADLDELLLQTDYLVCCTGAVGTVVDHEQVAAAMAQRPDRPLVVLDLALPHDTDPTIAVVPGVVRIDLTALADRPETHADQQDVTAAQQIVSDELDEFATAQAARAVEPVLLGLRARGSAVAEAELQRIRERLTGLSEEQWELVEQALRRTVNTLMHTPTVRIKQLASDPDGQRYADALSSLFDLPGERVEQVTRPRDPESEGEL